MPPSNGAPSISTELAEWDCIGPAQNKNLTGLSLADNVPAQSMAQLLRGRLDIRETYKGLEISSTSFVGHVDVGPLRITVRPKLPAAPLTRLLRYAYGLRDLGMQLDETRAPTDQHGLHDLLVALLAAEAAELLQRGLARQYVPRGGQLESPRGRILVQELASRGGIMEARLPCHYAERRADWQLNQVLRAGLDLASRITADPELRSRLHRLSGRFGEVASMTSLCVKDLDEAEQNLTRLTEAYKPALAIIRLLMDAQGPVLEQPGQPQRTPGFLFDMNIFFQRLLSRFLHDNLLPPLRIEDERVIRGVLAYAPEANPKSRRAPGVKPDYALFQARSLMRFLDAKYRDVWQRGCPAEWLYQLSLYALASPNKVSVLLYASMAEGASDERVDVRPPLPYPAQASASIVLRPVVLTRLAELVGPETTDTRAGERRILAGKLVSLGTHRPAWAT